MENEKYFEEKFKRVFDKLDDIEEHVKHTNGKVAEHELKITEELIERSSNRSEFKELKEDVNFCKVKLEKQDSELMEYRFFRKYPKAILYLSIGYVGLILYEVLEYLVF